MSAAPERLALWREGGVKRVLAGAATGFAGGASYAYFSRAAATPMRAGIACALLAAPFFTVREVVAASMRVHGPVASAVSGGVTGYFGALFTVGPCWNALSRSAMLLGVGCGVVDAFVSALEWKRKLYLLNAHEQHVANAAHRMHQHTDVSHSQSLIKWPYWFPVVKHIDHEYEELLRRQRATVQALEEERARIALLLHALEQVKAGKQVTDVQLADASLRSSSSSTSSTEPTATP